MLHAIEDVVHPAQMVSIVQPKKERVLTMLFTIAVILVILWLLGILTSYTMGGFIHLLVVIAIIAVLFRIISGRKIV